MAEANKGSAARQRRQRGAPREREADERRGEAGAPGEAPHWSDFAADPRGGTRKGRRSPKRGPGVPGPSPGDDGEPEVPWNCRQRRGQRGGTGEQQRDAWTETMKCGPTLTHLVRTPC